MKNKGWDCFGAMVIALTVVGVTAGCAHPSSSSPAAEIATSPLAVSSDKGDVPVADVFAPLGVAVSGELRLSAVGADLVPSDPVSGDLGLEEISKIADENSAISSYVPTGLSPTLQLMSYRDMLNPANGGSGKDAFPPELVWVASWNGVPPIGGNSGPLPTSDSADPSVASAGESFPPGVSCDVYALYSADKGSVVTGFRICTGKPG